MRFWAAEIIALIAGARYNSRHWQAAWEKHGKQLTLWRVALGFGFVFDIGGFLKAL